MSLFKSYERVVLRMLVYAIIACVGLGSVWGGNKKAFKKGPGYNDEYSMSVVALKGPNDTEVIVTLSTSNPESYPIPDALKKLQVKIKDENDDVVFIHNEKNPEVLNNQVIRFVEEPGPHEMLYIKALIPTSKNVIVLQAETEVLMRPDLIVDNIHIPESVDVDQPFNVTVNVREVLGESDAHASISLYADGEELVVLDNIAVAAHTTTSIVITGLVFTEPGEKNISILISGVVPTEYSETNNSFFATLDVIAPVGIQPTQYYATYTNYQDYNYVYWETCEDIWDSRTTNGTYDQLFLNMTYYDGQLTGEVDVNWSIAKDGVVESGSTIDLQPYDYGYNFYSYYDSQTAINFTGYAYPDRTTMYLQQITGQLVYVYYYDNGSVISTYTATYPSYNPAENSIDISILISGDNLMLGGGTSFSVGALYDGGYSYDASYEASCGTVYWGYEYDFVRATGFISGILDPMILPKPGIPLVENEPVLPDRIYLRENYPNPFNPQTSIEFGLPEAVDVSIKIYDITGREINSLISGHKSAGIYKVLFDGSKLCSGTYYCVLEAGGYRDIRKMLLLK